MITSKSKAGSGFGDDPQALNRDWWEANPMTYDWERSLQLAPGSAEWYQEIDRRFLSSAYYASDRQLPFGRFLGPSTINGKSVLEIGCGMGTHAALLLRAGARLTAVDLTERALKMTQRRFELSCEKVSLIRTDAECLPFQDGSFDVVWSWGVIHHSHSIENCICEISRVLRKGGRLMMMVYYRPSIVYYLHCGVIRGLVLGKLRHESLDQIYVNSTDGFYAGTFNKNEIRALLAPHFHDIKLTIVGLKAELLPIPRSNFKRRLESFIPNSLANIILRRWGSMIVAEAALLKPSVRNFEDRI